MNAEQKRAWFAVIVGVTCTVVFLIACPFVGCGKAACVFGLFGICGLSEATRVRMGRGEKIDERDLTIARRATMIGAVFSYMTFFVGSMGTWSTLRYWWHQTQISVDVLCVIMAFGALVFIFSRSIATLVLYGRKTEADN
jgi:hypothetical protein